MIKIDSPQALTPIEIANTEDNMKVGERVIVLGYPGVSPDTILQQNSTERGQVKARLEVIPEPTVHGGNHLEAWYGIDANRRHGSAWHVWATPSS